MYAYISQCPDICITYKFLFIVDYFSDAWGEYSIFETLCTTKLAQSVYTEEKNVEFYDSRLFIMPFPMFTSIKCMLTGLTHIYFMLIESNERTVSIEQTK